AMIYATLRGKNCYGGVLVWGDFRMDYIEYKLNVINTELHAIQENIDRYGQFQFTIKGWTITIFSGFILLAVEQSKPILLATCAISIVLFWIFDASFKCIQKIYI